MSVPRAVNTSLDFCEIALSFSGEKPPALGMFLSIINFGIKVFFEWSPRPPWYINEA